MRSRKTNQKDRITYKYEGSVLTKNGGYIEKITIIEPGIDGVTEAHIKLLHSMDDSEIYNNDKNAKPKRTSKEKAEIERAKQKIIREYIEQHGYEPGKDYVEYEIEQRFPKNYNLSLDFDNNGEIDPDKRLIASIEDKSLSEEFEWSESMEYALSLLTEKQKLVIELHFIYRYNQSEIAKFLKISSAAVSKLLNRALSTIKIIYKKNFVEVKK